MSRNDNVHPSYQILVPFVEPRTENLEIILNIPYKEILSKFLGLMVTIIPQLEMGILYLMDVLFFWIMSLLIENVFQGYNLYHI